MNEKEIKEKRNEYLKEYKIPEWVEIECVNCKKKINKNNIQSIGFHFNGKNMGDISVELICDNCRAMESYFFKTDCKNIEEMLNLLKQKDIKIDPISYHEAFKSKENNLLKRIFNG
jgi:hypothetical protein